MYGILLSHLGLIQSYNERKLQQGVKKKKKKKFSYFSQVKKISKIFIFIPDYCVPSDYFVKEELMIANYYVIKW